jgi:hypothetical protein
MAIDYCWYIQSKPYPQAAAVGSNGAQAEQPRIPASLLRGLGARRGIHGGSDGSLIGALKIFKIPSGYLI